MVHNISKSALARRNNFTELWLLWKTVVLDFFIHFTFYHTQIWQMGNTRGGGGG